MSYRVGPERALGVDSGAIGGKEPKKLKLRTIAAATAVVGLYGCGGSSGGSGIVATAQAQSSSTPTQLNAPRSPAAGIWTGTDTSTGLAVTAMIDGGGDLVAVRSDGNVYFDSNEPVLAVNGTSVSGKLEGDASFGASFPDGSTHGEGSISGTVQPAMTLTGTIAFTTDKGEATTNNVSLTYNALYDRTPALPSLAGTYTDAIGDSVTLDSQSRITATNADGCMATGRLNTIDNDKSLYTIILTYSTCSGKTVALSGLTFIGFATFDPATNIATVGLHDNAGANYGLALSLTKH